MLHNVVALGYRPARALAGCQRRHHRCCRHSKKSGVSGQSTPGCGH